MSDANNSLELDPALSGTLTGVLVMGLRKFLQGFIDDCLPCTVTATSGDRQYVSVRAGVMVQDTDGNLTTRNVYGKIPVFHIGMGGFVLTFPVNVGDKGWLKANDRDISLYLQSDADAGPNTNRMHSFKDGLFIPDAARLFTLNGADASRAVLQSLDGTCRIALGTDKCVITHPTLCEIAAPLQADHGIGFFGTTPPAAQPSITGHLSAVSDANAKAVLTSIIAVLSGNGEAANGTT